MAHTTSTVRITNSASYSFILLLVRCHQLRRHNRRNDVFRSYSLSFVAFIHYNDNVFAFNQPAPSNERSLASATNMRNFYLCFFSHAFLYRTFDAFCSFSIAGFRCRAAHCVFCCHVCSRACLPLQHVFRISHRTRELSNSSTVCQLPKETELELIAWICIASSYLYKSFQSFCRTKVWPFNRSFVRTFAAHNQLRDTRSFILASAS